MASKSDFMAAEEIKAILHGRDKGEQERIIRWVTESLALPVTTPAPPGAVSPPVFAPVGTHPDVQGGAGVRSKDIKTFVNEKLPKSDVQFAAVAAYFYRFESAPIERKETIAPKDLDQAARQARGYSFKNARMTLHNGVKLGYFDKAGEGAFRLNAVGENLVAMTLPGAKAATNGGKPRRAKRKLRAKKKAR